MNVSALDHELVRALNVCIMRDEVLCAREAASRGRCPLELSRAPPLWRAPRSLVGRPREGSGTLVPVQTPAPRWSDMPRAGS